jgi:hypothetical protein
MYFHQLVHNITIKCIENVARVLTYFGVLNTSSSGEHTEHWNLGLCTLKCSMYKSVKIQVVVSVYNLYLTVFRYWLYNKRHVGTPILSILVWPQLSVVDARILKCQDILFLSFVLIRGWRIGGVELKTPKKYWSRQNNLEIRSAFPIRSVDKRLCELSCVYKKGKPNLLPLNIQRNGLGNDKTRDWHLCSLGVRISDRTLKRLRGLTQSSRENEPR